MPAWYWTFRAARYLRVPAWELARRPIYWRQFALAAEEAESLGELDRQRKAARRAKRRGGIGS